MAAKDALNTELFHGTGSAIEGDVIHPGETHAYGYGAYATSSLHEARQYAWKRARDEGRLFGVVYRVSPVSEKPTVYGSKTQTVVDPKGMKAHEIVDYPTNIEALHLD